MQFSKAIDIYATSFKFAHKEHTTYGHILLLRSFAIFLRNPLITTVTDMHVMEWFNLHLDMGYDRNALLSKSQALRGFFKYWRQKKYPVMDYELIPKIKREYHNPPSVADEGDLEKVLTACDKMQGLLALRNKAMIMLYADTGMRNAELCSVDKIDTEHFDVIDGVKLFSNIIHTKKTTSAVPFRRVFWRENTNEVLNKWIKEREKLQNKTPFVDEDALFIGVRGFNIGRRMQNIGVCMMFKNVSRKAGLSYTFNCHSLRHRKGNILSSHNANISAVAAILGHSNFNSTKVYTNLNDKQMAEADVRFGKQDC